MDRLNETDGTNAPPLRLARSVLYAANVTESAVCKENTPDIDALPVSVAASAVDMLTVPTSVPCPATVTARETCPELLLTAFPKAMYKVAING